MWGSQEDFLNAAGAPRSSVAGAYGDLFRWSLRSVPERARPNEGSGSGAWRTTCWAAAASSQEGYFARRIPEARPVVAAASAWVEAVRPRDG